jgi:hypothetical protein
MQSMNQGFIKNFLFTCLALLISANVYASVPQKVKVSENDSTAGYLNGKLVAGTGITFSEGNDGANETLTVTNGLGTADGAAEFLYIEGATANNYEQILGSVDPTADRTFYFPDANLAASDVVVGSSANTAAYVNLGNTQMLIGDGSGVPTAAAMSGDATMTNAGVVTVADDSHSHTSATLPATTSYLGSSIDSSEITNDTIVNADINSAAAIDFSKLASLTSGNILVGNGSNVPTSVAMSGDATLSNAGVLAIAANSVDGTNIALGSDAAGDVMYYNGTDWARLAKGTTGQFLKTGTTPSWATPAGAGDMLQATYDTDANSVVDTATALAANGTNCSAGNYALGVDASGNAEGCTAISASGDASTNTSSSVDGEVALFSGTGGKTLKRDNQSGIAKLTSGVLSAVTAPSGTIVGTSDSQALTNKTLQDSTTSIVDDGDATKKIAFQASGITTGTTRTITVPDSNGTLVYQARSIVTTSPLAGGGDLSADRTLSITGDGIGPTQVDETANYAFTGTLINDGTNPTVATAGKIGFDTTQNQLLVGASTNVFSPTHNVCVTVSDVTSADDAVQFYTADRDIHVTSVGCRYAGTGSTVATFTLQDDKTATGLTITGTNPTCVKGNNTASFAAVTANNAITAGNGVQFSTTNTPNPTTDDYTICMTYTEDRK